MTRIVPFDGWLAGQDGENAGVWVVVGDGPNCVVQVQIVFECSVISSPAYRVIGRVMALSLEHLADILIDDLGKEKFTIQSSFLSSYQAVGKLKSLGLARPLAPMGPSSGKLKWYMKVSAIQPLISYSQSTVNLIPRGMTQNSWGFTVNFPI